MMNPNLQSQLYMKGVKGTELDSIIKFIYFGEVQVPASGIMKFLKAGNELEITELKKVMPVTGKTDQASHYKSVKTESVADTFDLEDHSNENREIAPTDDGEPTEEKVSNMKRHEVSPLKDSEQTEEDDAIVKRIREDSLLECPLPPALGTNSQTPNTVCTGGRKVQVHWSISLPQVIVHGDKFCLHLASISLCLLLQNQN